MSQQPELPDRIQRELEEALREGGVDKLPKHSRKKRAFKLGLPDLRPRNPGQLILIGVGLLILAYVIRFGPGMTIGIFCVAVAIATHFLQPSGSTPKFWRDRYVYIPSGRWQERVYRMIYRSQG